MGISPKVNATVQMENHYQSIIREFGIDARNVAKKLEKKNFLILGRIETLQKL